jgi:hypothetical protein
VLEGSTLLVGGKYDRTVSRKKALLLVLERNVFLYRSLLEADARQPMSQGLESVGHRHVLERKRSSSWYQKRSSGLYFDMNVI